MIRALVIAVALGAVALGACATDKGMVEEPCPAEAQAAVRTAVPGAKSVTCRVLRRPTQYVGNQVIKSTIKKVKVDVALPDGRRATIDMEDKGTLQVVGTTHEHGDLVSSSGKGMAVVFWLFALITVAGAVFVVTRRNLIAAVMGMVGSFLGIAAVYMLLYARFLAVVQMLVYAGAIMVLFVFVVMILNRPEDEPIAPSGRAGQVLGGAAILYLVARLILMLVRVQPPNPEVAMAAPPPLPEHCVAWRDNLCTATERHDWGSVGAVGSDLFNAGLFPFEAISILLLVAVVGAIAIARPLRADDADKASEGGAV